MAGIYIHIPFCKQACYYCNFHFSTQLQYKERVVKAIAKELFLRKDELKAYPIETIYWGGGTPSILSSAERDILLNALHTHYNMSNVKEFTLETNPDDMNEKWLQELKQTPVTRLSIGIQSLQNKHLQFMNRLHSAEEALQSVLFAQQAGFENISVDLIYGIPGLPSSEWISDLRSLLSTGVTHLSSYCLTVEPATVFGRKLTKGTFTPMEDELAQQQFLELIETSHSYGFGQYEISNFAKPGFESKHNTSYWKGEPYLGVGPGAHSFLPGQRMWNVANNQKYIRDIEAEILPLEKEILSKENQFNEFVMTRLRTSAGLSLSTCESMFGSNFTHQLESDLQPYLKSGKLLKQGDMLLLSKEGRFFADGIAAQAFRV